MYKEGSKKFFLQKQEREFSLFFHSAGGPASSRPAAPEEINPVRSPDGRAGILGQNKAAEGNKAACLFIENRFSALEQGQPPGRIAALVNGNGAVRGQGSAKVADGAARL